MTLWIDRCANGDTVEFHAELCTVRTRPPSVIVTLRAVIPYILAKGCELLHFEVLRPVARGIWCAVYVENRLLNYYEVIVEPLEMGMV